ncbi:CDGSH iron-sulfur domain-containing protein 2 [Narcine bancroftii]|uniref:CDGSH iron-sulfur domain-containing protein 2 n=1 Tax=Narcine bancroftii TaxID=1343680 RepID=UPI003831BAB3
MGSDYGALDEEQLLDLNPYRACLPTNATMSRSLMIGLFRKRQRAVAHVSPYPATILSSAVETNGIIVAEWLRLLPFLGVLALLGYLAIRPFIPRKKQQKDSLINLKIQKENPKVVNEINIEDLQFTKAAYCRCWRSKTFPVCDGSHNKHNELTGDNVGPLIIKKKEV